MEIPKGTNQEHGRVGISNDGCLKAVVILVPTEGRQTEFLFMEPKGPRLYLLCWLDLGKSSWGIIATVKSFAFIIYNNCPAWLCSQSFSRFMGLMCHSTNTAQWSHCQIAAVPIFQAFLKYTWTYILSSLECALSCSKESCEYNGYKLQIITTEVEFWVNY